MTRPIRAAGTFVLLAFFGLSACSGPSGLSDTSGPAASLSAADRTFIAQAAYGSLGEVALGEIAAEKALNPEVRGFGRTMVDEHTEMNEDLIAITSAKGVTPPSAPDPGRQAVASQLGELEGAAFDRQYVEQQLADHEATLTLFRNEANSGQDPELRAFAERYAPVIERHIGMLQGLRQITAAPPTS
jgi:putative membrane protein